MIKKKESIENFCNKNTWFTTTDQFGSWEIFENSINDNQSSKCENLLRKLY